MSTFAIDHCPCALCFSHGINTNVSKQLKTTEDVQGAPWPEPCIPVWSTIVAPVCMKQRRCSVLSRKLSWRCRVCDGRLRVHSSHEHWCCSSLLWAHNNILVPYQPTSIIGNRNEGNKGLGLRENIKLKGSIVFASRNNAQFLLIF